MKLKSNMDTSDVSIKLKNCAREHTWAHFWPAFRGEGWLKASASDRPRTSRTVIPHFRGHQTKKSATGPYSTGTFILSTACIWSTALIFGDCAWWAMIFFQMPRFGRQFKVYDKILPSQLLDVTDVIEDCKYPSHYRYDLTRLFTPWIPRFLLIGTL